MCLDFLSQNPFQSRQSYDQFLANRMHGKWCTFLRLFSKTFCTILNNFSVSSPAAGHRVKWRVLRPSGLVEPCYRRCLNDWVEVGISSPSNPSGMVAWQEAILSCSNPLRLGAVYFRNQHPLNKQCLLSNFCQLCSVIKTAKFHFLLYLMDSGWW